MIRHSAFTGNQQNQVNVYQRHVQRERMMKRLRWIVLILLILAIISFWLFWPFSQVSLPAALLRPISCSQSDFSDHYSTSVTHGLFAGATEYTGISNGQFAFDVDKTRLDFNLKCQGAMELRATHPLQAKADWEQATSIDTNDAEAYIYQENLKVLGSHRPYITVVVGSILSGNAVSIGRDFLQGVYLAQLAYNGQNNTPTPQVYLLVANFGSSVRENTIDGRSSEADTVNTVVNVITRDREREASGNSPLRIRGMVLGLPFINNTNVIQTLDHIGIPVVLAGSFSETQLQGTTNIFPTAPSTEREGQAAALYTATALKGRKIAVFQKQGDDPYSKALASAFLQSVRPPDAVVAQVQYTSTDSSQIFAQKIAFVTTRQADLIYFAGTSGDVNGLMTSLSPGTNMRVMGGAAFYELGGYTGQNYSRLLFTAAAFPDEWKFAPQSASVPPSAVSFLQAYPQNFGGSQPPNVYGYLRPDGDVLLANDALSALGQASSMAFDNGNNPNITSQDLTSALASLSDASAFQGFSGRISFGAMRTQKAVLILSADNGRTHMDNSFVYGCLLVASPGPC